jgi:antitoxin CptB
MSQEIRLKRLRYRSWHRGCKETDVLLGNFADSQLAALPPLLLDIYERLLDENDADIWDWITGKAPPARPEYTGLLQTLKDFGLPTE